MFDDPTIHASIIASIVAVTTALVGGIGWVSKHLVTGTTYYVGLAWAMLEKMATGHLTFIDKMSIEQTRQSTSLSNIEVSTANTSKSLSRMGSDPLKTIEEVKSAMVKELMEALAKQGGCKYQGSELHDTAEKVVERALESREKKRQLRDHQ